MVVVSSPPVNGSPVVASVNGSPVVVSTGSVAGASVEVSVVVSSYIKTGWAYSRNFTLLATKNN